MCAYDFAGMIFSTLSDSPKDQRSPSQTIYARAVKVGLVLGTRREGGCGSSPTTSSNDEDEKSKASSLRLPILSNFNSFDSNLGGGGEGGEGKSNDIELDFLWLINVIII